MFAKENDRTRANGYCPATSASSWTATAVGPKKAGFCPGRPDIRRAARRLSRKICPVLPTQIGIEYMTFYTFSTENWKRPKEEVDALMNLLHDYLKEALQNFKDENHRDSAFHRGPVPRCSQDYAAADGRKRRKRPKVRDRHGA